MDRLGAVELWVSVEQSLTPQEYELIKLRYKGGYTQQDLAEYLGISQPAIVRRLKKILTKLQWEL